MASPRAAQTARNTTGYRPTNTTQPSPTVAPAAPPAPGGGQTQPPAPPDAPPADPYAFVDPILQQIQALSTRSRADALSSALAARKQVAVALGDATGVVDDPNTAEAARQNPFSTLALLNKNYGDTTHQHEETLNKDNLWYSGAHAKQLGDDAFNYQQQTAQARGAAQNALGGINTSLASALSNADQQDIAGKQDAYGRTLQRNLAYGIDPGAAPANTSTSAPAGFDMQGIPSAADIAGGTPPLWKQIQRQLGINQ